MTRSDYLVQLAEQRILVLDGAMGTMIQRFFVTEEDVTFGDNPPAPGCNDLLSLTRPDLMYDIHLAYLSSGADIIETNTFGANRFALEEYGLAGHAYDINLAAVEVARSAVEDFEKENGERFAFVAGVVGPTGRSASFSPSVDDPAYREKTFHDFRCMYREQIAALLDGGVDLLLVETVFDTLAAKAAVVAAVQIIAERGESVPIMVSATFSDKSHRTLSGQTLEAFVASMSPFPLFSLGVNCSTGAAEMVPLIGELNRICPFRTSAHPNAGFPDRDGRYRQSPEELSGLLAPSLNSGALNIVGGCCGTTPAHIASLAESARKGKPRGRINLLPALRLSGLEALEVPLKHPFIKIGERTNVAGSRRFARLIREEAYEQALSIARSQIAQGAGIIDICMDDPLIDAPRAMVKFLRLVASDPETARVPVMVDSSSWEVIEAALPELQGRAIVNSISLKEGEDVFIERATRIIRMGAAVVVMLFDERGQADTFERKCEVAERSYRLLMEHDVCDPSSIVFDPNVLAIATGIDDHDQYARDFIRAVSWIKSRFPLVHISGGVSNLSFSFRGNTNVREAIHAVFIELAVEAGLDMAIVNPSLGVEVASLPSETVAVIREALLLERDDGRCAREALIKLAMQPIIVANAGDSRSGGEAADEWRNAPLFTRLSESLRRGEDTYLVSDLEEARDTEAVKLIEGPLMDGMTEVGRLFGEGKMFLPQVVRTARIMKKAVDILQPRLGSASTAASRSIGTVVLATVKGDVHDIGKNIVALVLRCNNFRVVDLGVMVPARTILKAAIEEQADMVGLSGLITPSLNEMSNTCALFKEEGVRIPILIGGATTSEEHTALKIAPRNPGRVIHTRDASHTVSVALNLMSGQRQSYLEEIDRRYARFRSPGQKDSAKVLDMEQARARRFVKQVPVQLPRSFGVYEVWDVTVGDLLPLVNWRMLVSAWRVAPRSDEAKRLVLNARGILAREEVQKAFETSIRAVVGLFPAQTRNGEEVVLHNPDGTDELAVFRFLRMQKPDGDGFCRSLADYVASGTEAPVDGIGVFVATAGYGIDRLADRYRKNGEEYDALLLAMVTDRLTEALSAYLNDMLSTRWWVFGATPSIRPAIGFPSAPDHAQKGTVFSLLNATGRIGVALTETYAMTPTASVCGFYFVGEGCRYFSLGELGNDQLRQYAAWRGIDMKDLEGTMRLYNGLEVEKERL